MKLHEALKHVIEAKDTKDSDVVQELWYDMCTSIQPGSAEGYESMRRAIDSGFPEDVPEKMHELLRKAKADKYPAGVYGEHVPVFKLISQGSYYVMDEGESKEYVMSTYGDLIDWCNEVFGRHF